jgi:arsenite methyltransferase
LRPFIEFSVYKGEYYSINTLREEIHMNDLKKDKIRNTVRETYGKVATSKAPGCGCTGDGCCGSVKSETAAELSLALGYSDEEVAAVPEGANMGLGCGNPQAIAGLKTGEVVLDLGSGGGFDAFLAARQVGELGHVIGVDMTAEMISKARSNADRGGYHNVEFRLGEIESLPIANETVDVIISNCVINLSPEKPRVYSESFRVLKPGGRLAISDIVAFAELPEEAKKDLALYTGCIAGASMISEVMGMLRTAGFENITVKPVDVSKSFISEWTPGKDFTDYVLSASIEAIKPYRDESLGLDRNLNVQSVGVPESGCCGGPADDGVDACCALDATEKAKGKSGCGCSDQIPRSEKDTRGSCCG